MTGKFDRMKTKLNYKFPNIKKENLKNEIDTLSKNLNLKTNFKVTKLGKKLFFIE